MSALPHAVQLALWIGGAIVLLGAAPCFLTARERFRRVRTADVYLFGLLAGLGWEGLVRDSTGIHGSPRAWGIHADDAVWVLPARACEWLEQLFTDRRFTILDGPELDGGWSRMGVSRPGRRMLKAAGVVEAAGPVRLASRRHARAVAAAEVVDRAA